MSRAEKNKQLPELQVVHPRAAGIDVGSQTMRFLPITAFQSANQCSMASTVVAFIVAPLSPWSTGPSYSRPRVSDDNAFVGAVPDGEVSTAVPGVRLR